MILINQSCQSETKIVELPKSNFIWNRNCRTSFFNLNSKQSCLVKFQWLSQTGMKQAMISVIARDEYNDH